MARELEHQEQVALFNWAKFCENKCPLLRMMFSIPNGGKRHITVARKLKAEGVKAGVPDIFLPVPVEGFVKETSEESEKFYSGILKPVKIPGLFIEMKVGKNKLTENQVGWFNELKKHGYQYNICYSWIEAAKVICEYLDLDPDEYGLEDR